MSHLTVAAVAYAAAASVMLAACGASETDGTALEGAVRAPETTAHGAAGERPQGVVEDCSTRSEADFPGAFSDRDNVVVGPLVLVGAASTPPDTVREFGGTRSRRWCGPGTGSPSPCRDARGGSRASPTVRSLKEWSCRTATAIGS
jgi:hypothetical protein